MISMAEKMYIKQLYEDGVSKSEIQRRTKLRLIFAILHPAMRKAMLRTRSATSGATPSFRSLRSSALMSSTTTCLTGVKRTLNVRITSVVIRYRAFGKMKKRSC